MFQSFKFSSKDLYAFVKMIFDKRANKKKKLTPLELGQSRLHLRHLDPLSAALLSRTVSLIREPPGCGSAEVGSTVTRLRS